MTKKKRRRAMNRLAKVFLPAVLIVLSLGTWLALPSDSAHAHFDNCRGWSELSSAGPAQVRYSSQTKCDNDSLASIGVAATLWKITGITGLSLVSVLETNVDFRDNAVGVSGDKTVTTGRCYLDIGFHGGVIVHRHTFLHVPYPHPKTW